MSQIPYRKINFPKINWTEDDSQDLSPELSKEIRDSLKEVLDTITNKNSINPHLIQDGKIY